MSPRSPSDNFVAQKNAKINRPITLLHIVIDPDNPAYDLYVTPYDEDVVFDGQTYTGNWPLDVSGVGTNAEGAIQSVTVTVSRLNAYIQSYIEAYDGLRGNDVTISLVFSDQLDDSTAVISDTFVVDSVTCTYQAAAFVLRPKLDVLNIDLPRHRYRRNHCRHDYKGVGCWKDDGGSSHTQPTDFLADYIPLTKEAVFGTDEGIDNFLLTNNTFSDTGYARGDVVRAGANLPVPVVLKGMDIENRGTLYIDLKVSDTSLFTGGSNLYLSSTHDSRVNSLYYIGPIAVKSVGTSWTTCSIDLSSFHTLGTGLSNGTVAYIEFSATMTAAGTGTVYLRNASIRTDNAGDYVSVAHGEFQPVDCSGIALSSQNLSIDIKCDNYGRITSASRIEIYSDSLTNGVLYRDNLLTIGTVEASGKSITDSWQTFVIPLSYLTQDPAGSFDLTTVKGIRIWAVSTTGELQMYWRNPRLDTTDSCNKTLLQCIQHGNQKRFGGFPGIPSRRAFYG